MSRFTFHPALTCPTCDGVLGRGPHPGQYGYGDPTYYDECDGSGLAYGDPQPLRVPARCSEVDFLVRAAGGVWCAGYLVGERVTQGVHAETLFVHHPRGVATVSDASFTRLDAAGRILDGEALAQALADVTPAAPAQVFALGTARSRMAA